MNDINGSSDRWTIKLFISIARENIPNKIVTIRPNGKPLYNNEHCKLRHKHDRAHREAKRLKPNSLWEKYRQIRNLYNRSIIEAKEEHVLKLKNYLAADENICKSVYGM